MKDDKKAVRDLEEVRNSSEEVRSFRHVHGHIKGNEDYSNHPEGCTCGHCGKDHNHSGMGHIPKHSHGDGCSHTHEPDCAVKAAVEAGSISSERYDAYVNIYQEIAAEKLLARKKEYK